MTLTATTTVAVTPSEATARMTDGTLLRTLHWTPDGNPWAVALIVHGLGEHGGRYGNVAGPLTAAGVDVNAYDHRGFGGSAGPRAYVDRWSQLHDDLQEVQATLRARNPGLPIVMYGHSMGGLIAAGYVLSDEPRSLPDLLVLSAPGLDADIPGWRRTAASVLTGVVPRMKVANGLAQDGLSRDPAVRAAFLRDPLCQMSSTIRFGAEAFEEQARVRAAVAKLDHMPIPTYVLHGSADPIVPPAASAALGTRGNVTRVVHEGLRHECHNEPEHAAVLAGVVTWLRAQAQALTTAQPATTLASAAEGTAAATV